MRKTPDPNYKSQIAIQIYDRIIEQFGVIAGIHIAPNRMKRIPIDRTDLSDSLIEELIRRSDEYEELLRNAGIIKSYHGIGAYRYDSKFIYVYVYRTQ